MVRGNIMFKQIKTKVTIMLVLLIFVAMLPQGLLNFHKEAYAKSAVKIGDYVQFGKYLNKPILWRVINLEADGTPLLFSEKILCLKPFDVSESGKVAVPGGNYSKDLFRQEYGSGKWENSNLREWLNSKNKTVKYTTQPPIKAAIWNGYNDYATEAGFLSNFSEAERNIIKPMTRKSLLSNIDKSEKDGGLKAHKADYIISSCVTNYDTAYYKNLSDQVYLLSVKELHDYVYSRGWEYRKMLTKEAVRDSDLMNNYDLNDKKYWFYWSSTPSAEYSNSVRIITEQGSTYMFLAHYFSVGVVPAINLSTGAITAGKGTKGNPYICVRRSNK